MYKLRKENKINNQKTSRIIKEKCNLKKKHEKTKIDSLQMNQHLSELRLNNFILMDNLSTKLEDQIEVKDSLEDKKMSQ